MKIWDMSWNGIAMALCRSAKLLQIVRAIFLFQFAAECIVEMKMAAECEVLVKSVKLHGTRGSFRVILHGGRAILNTVQFV